MPDNAPLPDGIERNRTKLKFFFWWTHSVDAEKRDIINNIQQQNYITLLLQTRTPFLVEHFYITKKLTENKKEAREMAASLSNNLIAGKP